MSFQRIMSIGLIGLTLFFTGCARQIVILSSDREEHSSDPRAIGLFVDALSYELNQNYAAALLMYQEALLYDSSASTIYLNISKNYLRLGKDESAVLALKRCLELDPNQLEAWDILASIYTSQGRLELTEKAYLSMITRDSTDERTFHKLALLYLRTNQNEKAADVYQLLLRRSRVPDPKILIALGEIYFSLKQFKKAGQFFQELANIHPESGFGYFGLGLTREALMDTSEAIRFYSRAIECTPTLNEARDRLGKIYIAQQSWDKAIQIYTDAIEKDTTNLESWLELGDLYQETNDTLNAENLYREVQLRFPEDWNAHLNHGRFLMRQQAYSQALASFKKVIDLSPDNALGWLFSGFALTHLDSLEAARDHLAKALSIYPEDPMGNYYLGTVYLQLERFDEAIESLKQAIKVRPKWISALNALANAYESLKYYSHSDSVFQFALSLEPTNALLLNNYGYSLSLRGERLEDALNMALSALEQDPDNGAYMDTVGWIYFRLGRFEQALDYIKRAAVIHEKSYEVYDHLGDVYAALNMPDKAREAWEHALKLDKNNVTIQKKLSQSFE